MERKYLTIDDLESYRISYALANYVWDIVIEWEWFAKKTVGTQFVTATDSIAANIAEGFGRYNKKDKIRFYRYSQGSAKEIKNWCRKSTHRKLITQEQSDHILKQVELLGPAINRLIKFTNDKLKF